MATDEELFSVSVEVDEYKGDIRLYIQFTGNKGTAYKRTLRKFSYKRYNDAIDYQKMIAEIVSGALSSDDLVYIIEARNAHQKKADAEYEKFLEGTSNAEG